MKNVISTLVAVCMVFSLSAQNFIEDNYQHFMDHEDATVVYVSSKMFEMASTILDGVETDDQDLQTAKSMIQSIHFLSLVRMPNLEDANGEFKRGIKKLNGQYDELVKVRDGSTHVSVNVRGDADLIEHIVVLVADEKEFVAVEIGGLIELEKVADLIQEIEKNETAGASLRGVFNTNIEDVKVYPNPLNVGNAMTVETNGLEGGEAIVTNVSGEQLLKSNITSDEMTLDTQRLPAGQYVLTLSKDTYTISKKFIVIQ